MNMIVNMNMNLLHKVSNVYIYVYACYVVYIPKDKLNNIEKNIYSIHESFYYPSNLNALLLFLETKYTKILSSGLQQGMTINKESERELMHRLLLEGIPFYISSLLKTKLKQYEESISEQPMLLAHPSSVKDKSMLNFIPKQNIEEIIKSNYTVILNKIYTDLPQYELYSQFKYLYMQGEFEDESIKDNNHRSDFIFNFHINFFEKSKHKLITKLTHCLYALPFELNNNYPTFQCQVNDYVQCSYFRENFSYVNARFSGNMEQNAIVQASWFDRNAIRYSVPVNSRKPSYSLSGTLTYNQPFGEKRYWTFSTYADVSYSASAGYQAKEGLEGMDIEEFDYNDFMSVFWGNSSGDRFYSGDSGFSESKMTTLHYALDLGLKYQRDRFNASVHAYGRNQISKYSLDPDANADTWMHSYSFDAMYTTLKNWEFSTKINANFYIGYSAGFGAPQYNWNASISKTIKSVTLSLKGIDLLNQASRNLQRTATNEYIMDTYRNVLGRYFLFSVSFNFGKMNAKKSQAVQDATWNLML
jgi:hypothetical protein